MGYQISRNALHSLPLISFSFLTVSFHVLYLICFVFLIKTWSTSVHPPHPALSRKKRENYKNLYFALVLQRLCGKTRLYKTEAWPILNLKEVNL